MRDGAQVHFNAGCADHLRGYGSARGRGLLQKNVVDAQTKCHCHQQTYESADQFHNVTIVAPSVGRGQQDGREGVLIGIRRRQVNFGNR